MKDAPEWKGTNKLLCDELRKVVGDTKNREWPDSPLKFRKRINQYIPDLKKRGIQIEIGKGKGRFIHITSTNYDGSDGTTDSSNN